MKVCTKCNESKDIGLFHNTNRSWCKACVLKNERISRRKVSLKSGEKINGMLYIIGNINYPDCYKVGLTKSSDISRRLETLNGGCPYRGFKKIFSFDINSHLNTYEACAHRRLKLLGLSMEGEWFKGNIEDIKKIVLEVTMLSYEEAYDSYRGWDE